MRRGEDVEIVEEQGGTVRGWRLWGEWVEDAWGAAVDRWSAKGCRIGWMQIV